MKKILWIISGSSLLLCSCFLLTDDDCGGKGTGCEGNVAVWCENDDFENPFSHDCAEENLVCVRDSSDFPPHCVLPCSKEKLEDVIVDGCIDSKSARIFTCQENLLKKLLVLGHAGAEFYYAENSKDCEHGCDSDTGDCKKLHPDEYQACDDSYIPSCYHAVLSYCGKDRIVHTKDCQGSSQVCGIADGEAKCIDACTPQDYPEKSSCLTIDGQIFSRHQYCHEGIPSEEDTPCKYGCLEQSGVCKLVPEEGEACNISGNQCKDDILLFCASTDKIAAVDCTESQKHCGHDSENRYGCMDTCKEAVDLYLCSEDGYSTHLICTRQDKYIFKEEIISYCDETGCDHSTGRCKHSIEN